MRKVYKLLYYSCQGIILLFGLSATFFIICGVPSGYSKRLPIILHLLGLLMAEIYYYYWPLLAARSGKILQITTGPIYGALKEVLISCGLGTRRFTLYTEPSRTKRRNPNAIAQGFSDLTIVLRHGIIDVLPPEELVAIMYHEAGHVVNRHVLYPLVGLGLTLLSLLAVGIVEYGSLPNALAGSVMVALAVVQFVCVALLFGALRKGEYVADAFAATRWGSEHLINALQKITTSGGQPKSLSVWRELVSTHPSLEKRIERIKGIATTD